MMPRLLRQNCGSLCSIYGPLYEAWVGAAAAFFDGAAVFAFLGGILIDGYGMVVESMNFQTRCWMTGTEVVDVG